MIQVSLIVVQGKPEGKTIPLTGAVFRVGRDETCHLRPSSDQVSRQHAEIVVGPDSATIKDLGSRNGTHLNGRLLTEPTRLKSGDLVKIGPLTFAVSLQGETAQAASGGRPAPGPKSLDEVGQEEVESWLIADNSRPVPDRPSGVYDGDTITIESYKGGTAKPPVPAAPRPKSDQGAPKPRPEPAPARPAAQPAPAPVPAPAAAPAPLPPPAPVAASEPSPAPAAPAPAAPAATVTETETVPTPPVSEPVPAAAVAAAPAPGQARSFLDEIEEFERLPEGQGDAEAGAAGFEDEDEEEAAASAASGPSEEEWVDESNPFYAAKRKAQEPAEEAKPSFKDSSEAADAILKKMLERRKAR